MRVIESGHEIKAIHLYHAGVLSATPDKVAVDENHIVIISYKAINGTDALLDMKFDNGDSVLVQGEEPLISHLFTYITNKDG